MDGQLELIDFLNQEINKVDSIELRTEQAAKEFVKDLSKLARPKSQIVKNGYTHLVDTFSYRKSNNDIEVGWGKYYGPMVERGTKKTKAQPHLIPTFKKIKKNI